MPHDPNFTVFLDDVTINLARCARLADRAAVADIEGHCPVETLDGVKWYDLRPMLDPREFSPECIDMSREAIDHALVRGLVKRHPEHAHLLRVVRP